VGWGIIPRGSVPAMATDLTRLVDQVCELGDAWHDEGTVADSALYALLRHAPSSVERSLETGAGRSTLVLSHLSREHTVFALRETGSSGLAGRPTGSSHGGLGAVRRSSLLRAENATFVEGPSQQTLPRHDFAALDVAFIDGPHAYPFPELEYALIYPHLRSGALLVIDDVHIPTVGRMWDVLREDAMFDELEVSGTTGFLRRTSAPTFPPDGDGWETQAFNARRYPNRRAGIAICSLMAVKRRVSPRAWESVRSAALRCRLRPRR